MRSKHNGSKAALTEFLGGGVLVDALVEESLSAQNLLVPEELSLLTLEVNKSLLCGRHK